MDAVTASLITAVVTTAGAIVVAKINNKSKTRECEKHRRELEAARIRNQNSREHHYFFAKMQHYISSVIPCLKRVEGISGLKLKMLQKFLLIKFKIFKAGMEEWVIKEEDVKLNDLVKYILMLVEHYEREAEEQGIPKMFIESFAREHSKYVEATIQSIEQITRCESYDNVDKENSVLDILLHAFTMTIYTAESTAKSMNGELEALLLKTKELV